MLLTKEGGWGQSARGAKIQPNEFESFSLEATSLQDDLLLERALAFVLQGISNQENGADSHHRALCIPNFLSFSVRETFQEVWWRVHLLEREFRLVLRAASIF